MKRWRYSVTCVRSQRPPCCAAQMRRPCAVLVMRKYMQLISWLASIKGFLWLTLTLLCPSVIFVRFLLVPPYSIFFNLIHVNFLCFDLILIYDLCVFVFIWINILCLSIWIIDIVIINGFYLEIVVVRLGNSVTELIPICDMALWPLLSTMITCEVILCDLWSVCVLCWGTDFPLILFTF